MFIEITLDASRISPEVTRALAPACPVDIFKVDGGRLLVDPDQVDECTLCEVCLRIAPAGALAIRKLYKDERIVSWGGDKTHEPA